VRRPVRPARMCLTRVQHQVPGGPGGPARLRAGQRHHHRRPVWPRPADRPPRCHPRCAARETNTSVSDPRADILERLDTKPPAFWQALLRHWLLDRPVVRQTRTHWCRTRR
jgi:hypothetical protein